MRTVLFYASALVIGALLGWWLAGTLFDRPVLRPVPVVTT